MRKALLIGLMVLCLSIATAGIAIADTSSQTSASFTVAPMLAVQSNGINFNSVAPGTNELDGQTVFTVSSNVPWAYTRTTGANFTRSDGATIPFSNLMGRPAGTQISPQVPPTYVGPITETGESMPTVRDLFLTIPWNITPSNEPFTGTITITVMPQP